MKNISLYLRKKKSAPPHERKQSENRPFLLPHLLESVGNVERADLLVVLELEEFVPSVSGHVNEDIGTIVGQEPFRARHRRVDST